MFHQVVQSIKEFTMSRQSEVVPEHAHPATLATTVYDRIRNDVLTGNLQPGSWLRLRELIDLYETGNSPLREALSRLASNGVVNWEENRGFSVPTASIDGLKELFRTRCWMEEIALRKSILNGDNAWEERIVLAFHWLSHASMEKVGTDGRRSADLAQHHQNYHMALISACGSKVMLDYCEQLQNRTFRYRNLATRSRHPDRNELEEHRALQAAVLQRNADLAVSLLQDHYMATCEILLASDRFQ
jgi:DNA-binding GntR family transcriptional regulator